METLKGTKRRLSSAFPKSPKSSQAQFASMLQYLRSAEAKRSTQRQKDIENVILLDESDSDVEIEGNRALKASAPMASISLPTTCPTTQSAILIPSPSSSLPQKQSGMVKEVISLVDEDDYIMTPASRSALKTRAEISVIDLSIDSDGFEGETSTDAGHLHNEVTCIICEMDLSHLDESAREDHLQQCLDEQGIDGPEYSQPHDQESMKNVSVSTNSNAAASIDSEQERGLRLPVFFCVLCDVDLSRRNLVNRCMHLKRCAREKNMSTKQLLQFIAPIDDEDDVEEEEEELKGEIDEAERLPSRQSTNGSVTSVSEIASAMSLSGNTNTKNAWAIMMSSAKEQAKMKGMFEVQAKNLERTIKSGQLKTSTSSGNSRKSWAASSSSAWPTRNKSKGSTKQKGGGASTGTGNSGYAPSFKKVQAGNMTYPIIVDGFQFASPLLSDCYFLTHFHSDHYMGLTKDFNCGQIYCSQATAALVKLKLNVSLTRLVALELDRQYSLSVGGMEVEVTLTDANHCPGAVCIVFRFPSVNRTILHTGDFRWTNNLLRSSAIFRQLSQSADSYNIKHLTVYLDTTYCDEQYSFPHQDQAINAVIDCVREESKHPGALYVFGAYAIGKERVFMAAAEELNMKVYVEKARWKSMMCFDWTTEQQARLTTDPTTTNLWVVPLNHINFNALEKLKRQKSRCNRVVAFQPTGWTHNNNGSRFNRRENLEQAQTKSEESSSIVHARRKEGHVIYSVPYSEHSSFRELVDFVSTFKPNRIVPTVNTSAENVQKQLHLLKNHSNVYAQTAAESETRHTEDSEDAIPLQRQTSGPSRVMVTTGVSQPIAPTVKNTAEGSSIYLNDLDEDDFVSEFQ